jgi:hypothetical protein
MPLKPPPMTKREYERIPVYQEWINGVIEEIESDPARKSIWKGVEKVGPAVRLKFKLDGCEYLHSSGWLNFNYAERSTLYKKYLSALVEGARPFMDFDLEKLKGMKIKTMWSENGEYDRLEMIKPAGSKIDPNEEKVPF